MSMAPGDLVTLAAVKNWLGLTATNSDLLIGRLIRSASAAVLNYCNKNVGFGWGPVTTVYDGNNHDFLVMRETQITDITSIDLGDGTLITAMATGSPPSNGWLIPDESSSQQRLVLRGYCFPKGRSNITVVANAGYRVQAEAWTVPAGSPYTVSVMLSWLGDLGVTLANGTKLTLVTGTPGALQYNAVDGVYTFNVAQASAGVLISYQQCPEDVAQAVIELIGERYKVTQRIGEVSHSMGGQVNTTTSFAQKDMNDFIKSVLQRYRKEAPA